MKIGQRVKYKGSKATVLEIQSSTVTKIKFDTGKIISVATDTLTVITILTNIIDYIKSWFSVILVIIAISGCNLLPGSISITDGTAEECNAIKDTAYYDIEIPVTSGVSYFIYRMPNQLGLQSNPNANKLIKFLESSDFDQDSITFDRVATESRIGSAFYLIHNIEPFYDNFAYYLDQYRETYQGVFNNNAVTSIESRTAIIECEGFAELGDTIYLSY